MASNVCVVSVFHPPKKPPTPKKKKKKAGGREKNWQRVAVRQEGKEPSAIHTLM